MNQFLFLTESDSAIEKKILNALKEEINLKVPKAIPGIKERLREITADFIKNTPEYQALLHGPLRAEFGFYSGTEQSKVDNIVNMLSYQIAVDFQPTKILTRSGAFSGGLHIGIVESTFDAIIKSQSAVISYYSKRYNRQVDLNWLKWLLLEGDKIIVSEYHFVPATGGRGRSGGGLMKAGGLWRVPPEYSGTPRRNWITRALVGQMAVFEIYSTYIIQQEIENKL